MEKVLRRRIRGFRVWPVWASWWQMLGRWQPVSDAWG
ncbi:hypothetical protein V6Z12_D03G184600 [Gossypium hirsutum]